MKITLKEALRRVHEAKTFADIAALFMDAFGMTEMQIRGAIHIPGLPDAEAPVEIADAAKLANPNFAKGGGYARNCQRCAPAYELLRRGIKIYAMQNPNPDRTGTSKRQQMNGSECFKGAVVHGYSRDTSFPLDKPQLLKALNLLPNGARASIFWVAPDRRQGHIIVCEKSNGQLVFLDPQSGEIGKHVLGRPNRENGYYWFRMDNLELDGDFEWDEIVTVKL